MKKEQKKTHRDTATCFTETWTLTANFAVLFAKSVLVTTMTIFFIVFAPFSARRIVCTRKRSVFPIDKPSICHNQHFCTAYLLTILYFQWNSTQFVDGCVIPFDSFVSFVAVYFFVICWISVESSLFRLVKEHENFLSKNGL